MNALAIALHLLASIVWVGGMFFAHQALRPAALKLDPPVRLPLWCDTFARFFPWVWIAIILLPVSGYWMLFNVHGGFATAGLHIHIMQLLGAGMIGIFLFVYFVPYRALQACVAAKDFPAGANQLARIRKLVGVNIILGLVTATVAGGGRLL